MHRLRSLALAAGLVSALAASWGCSSAPTDPGDVIGQALTERNEALIDDADRRDEAQAHIDELAGSLSDFNAAFIELNRDFRALNADYDTPRSDFDDLTDRFDETRRRQLQRFMIAAAGLRAAVSDAEWAEMNDALRLIATSEEAEQ